MRIRAIVLLVLAALSSAVRVTAAEHKEPKVTLSFSWETNTFRTDHPGSLNTELNGGGDFWRLLVASTKDAWSGPLGYGLGAGTSDPSANVFMWGASHGPATGTTLDIFNGRTVSYGRKGVPFRADVGLRLGDGWRLTLGYAQSATQTVTQSSYRDYLFVEDSITESFWCSGNSSLCYYPHYIPLTTVDLSRRYRSSAGTVSTTSRVLSLGAEKRVDTSSNAKAFAVLGGGVDFQVYHVNDTTQTHDYIYSVFMPEGIKDFHPGAREDPAMYRDEIAGAALQVSGTRDTVHARPYVSLGVDWWIVRHLGVTARVRYYPLEVSQSTTADSAIGPYDIRSSSFHTTFSAGATLGF